MNDATAQDLSHADAVRRAVDHAAHLLPAQGPIGVFIHHNTLHAFEDRPFEQAVVDASRIFGTEPYISEAAYRRELARERILPQDIDFVLEREPNASILEGLDRRLLRRRVLYRGLRPLNAANVDWLLEEGGFLEKLRDDLEPSERRRLVDEGVRFAASEAAAPPHKPDQRERMAATALFSVCRTLVASGSAGPTLEPRRPRDGFLVSCGVDLDEIVHPLLVRLCAVFLDQGQTYWPMPRREQGFLSAVRRLLSLPGALYPEFLRGLDHEFERQDHAGFTATEVVADALAVFSVPEGEWENVIRAELLALPGWAGLMRRLEKAPDLAPHERVPASLTDFLAVRLTLNKTAAANLTRKFRLRPLVSCPSGS